MKIAALRIMKSTIFIAVIALMLLFSCIALAGTMTLPAGLTEIEEEAFMNDASLDTVIIPEGVVSIGRRAFAGTSLTHLTLPSTLEFIGTDAFRNCDNMSITAPEGSWAYEWALIRGYIKSDPNTPTQVVLSSTIQAGEDLTISIIGASNTVRHGVYLIKNSDQSKLYRALTQSSGQLTWEGYELETGDYKLTVYTVTDTFKSLTPVEYNLSITGSKPVADAIEFPNSILAGDDIDLTFSDYERCFAAIKYIDVHNTVVDSYDMGVMYNSMFIWTDYAELREGGSVIITYSPKVNGLWCQPMTATIAIIPDEPLGTPDIVFPSQILAGQDVLILCDWVENATHYTYELYSSGNSLFSITFSLEDGFESGVYYIPGYLLSAGDYELRVNTYNRYGSDYYHRQSYEFYPFTVTGEWLEAPEVTPAQETVRINSSAIFVIDTKEADQIVITWQYDGYAEQTDTVSTVNDKTEWTIRPAERYANKKLTLQFSIHKNDRWSAKKTLIYNVEDIEQLASPVIHTNTEYVPGKNTTFSFDAVEHASKYTIELYRDETRIAQKTNSTEQYLDINGYDLLPGNYRFVVTAYGDGFRNSSSEEMFTVAGTMPSAPILTSEQEKVYEGKSVSIVISSDNAEGAMISVLYYGEDGSIYAGYTDNYSLSSTGIDMKSFNISSYPGKTVQISACTTANDTWSAWSEPLIWTILPREQLASPAITVNETFNAGEDVIIQLSEVENAESYNVKINRVYGNDRIYSTTIQSSDALSVTVPGHLMTLASYRVTVTASASEYKTSAAATKTFKVSGEWPEAPEVTLKENVVRINSKATFLIDTEEADLARINYQVYTETGDYYDSYTYNYSVTSSQTEWTYSPSEYTRNGTLTLQVAVHKNNRWSAWKTLSYTIEDLEQLAQPIIHIDNEYPAGRNATLSFDAVEHATRYDYYLYRGDDQISSEWHSVNTYLDVNGYLLSPADYRFIVTAYGDGFRSNTSEATFKVTGILPSAPVLTSDQEKVYEGESVSIAITSANAEGVRVWFRYYNADGSFYNDYINNYSMTAAGPNIKTLSIWSYPGKTVQISACTTSNDTWSAWSEPLTWTILAREQLASPAIIVNETFSAGEDVTIQLSEVEHAESYYVEINRVYGNDRIYSSTIQSSDALSVNVPGYLMTLASYRVTVTASASEYKTSAAATKTFKVSGEWPEAPEVTLQEDVVRINSKATFVIDTEGADLTRISYSAIMQDGNLYNSSTRNLTAASSQTEWSYTPSEYTRNGTLTLQVAVHKNNHWSAWKTLSYTIEDLEQLSEPIIHIDSAYPAGKNATFSFDPVEHATRYDYYLYRGDEQISYERYSINTYLDVNGYLLSPANYRFIVTAYGDGFRSNTSETTFKVTGILPTAPVLTSEQEKVYEGESVSITIASNNAEGILVSFDYFNEDGNLIDSYTNNYSMNTTSANVKKFNIWSYPGKTVQISACTTANDTWSAWSEPLTWTILAREQLASSGITVNETFSAGEDVTIQLSEVENAESYYVEINRVYGNDRIYSTTINSSDALSVTVPGYLMTLASYRVTVTASASEYKTSTAATKTFKVSGEWLEAPEVMLKEDVVRINSEATFVIDTEGADLARISYRAVGNASSSSNTINSTVTSNQTEWSYTPSEWARNGTLTLQVAVYKNNRWSAWKTLTYAIEDLEQLSQPTIKIKDSYQAGENIVLRFDAVENAESYEWRVYENTSDINIYSGSKNVNSTYSIYGYNIEPGTYRYSVTAYANGYRSNTSEKVFTIIGTKNEMGTITTDKTTVKAGETFTFTLDTTGLSALRYRINQNSSYSINVINNITRFASSTNNEGEQRYQFAGLKNGYWTAWSDPILITVEKNPEIEPPIVSVNNTIHQGENLSIAFTEISNSNNYYEISIYNENSNRIFDYYTSYVDSVTVDGYTLTPGTYSVRVSAYINYQWISSPNKTVIVLPSTLSTAPEILNSPSESLAGSYVSFSISTSDAEKLAIRYCRDGYTNDISTETVTVTEATTQWQQKRTTAGQTWFYQFAVYRNGAWSEWTAWQTVQIVAEQSSN